MGGGVAYGGGVSNLPMSSPYRSQPDKPVTETVREDFTQRLNDAFTEGDVPQDEYRVMLDGVYAADTYGQLAPIAERLPVKQTYQQPGIVATESTSAPGEVTPHREQLGLSLWVMAGAAVALLIVALILGIIII